MIIILMCDTWLEAAFEKASLPLEQTFVVQLISVGIWYLTVLDTLFNH